MVWVFLSDDGDAAHDGTAIPNTDVPLLKPRHQLGIVPFPPRRSNLQSPPGRRTSELHFKREFVKAHEASQLGSKAKG